MPERGKNPNPKCFSPKLHKTKACIRGGCLEFHLLMCSCDFLPSQLFLLSDKPKAYGWSGSRSILSLKW